MLAENCEVQRHGAGMDLGEIVDLARHPVETPAFRAACRVKLDETGVLVLPDFLTKPALAQILTEAQAGRDKAYFCTQEHSVYLAPDPSFPEDHPANRRVVSSKGCICDDDVAAGSPLRALYEADGFKSFVKAVVGQGGLYPYADPLSSINIHYAERGQELGWHFDNSSFAITLLLQKPDAGGRFEYVTDLRDTASGDMNYRGVEALLDGELKPNVLEMEPGALVLFRGRNSVHRVSPNESDRTRILAVLAYNAEPGVSLSESARMTFFGRLG
ncbi:MAG: 2OG-Fe(II) oxygenase [Pseudomonadota bacterium]